ncbi:hypothetical protein D9M72_522010 [compost metagenome]
MRREGVALGVVDQREGVGRGADGLKAVAPAGGQVGRAGKARDHGRAGRRRGGFLMRAAGTHLNAGPVAGGAGHSGRGRGDGAVVVQHRQDVGLQDAGLGEGRFHDQDGGVRKVGLALRVAPDVTGEPEGGQVFQRVLINHPGAGQEIEVVLVKAEVHDAFKESAGAGHDPVPAPGREPAGKGLEDGPAVCGPGLERRLEHGQLIVISKQ